MFPQILLALLSDSSGRVLLVRRKDSALWSLPGSAVRVPAASRSEFLAGCCRRQIGVTPEFSAPLAYVTLAGLSAEIGVDEISSDRARACGRTAETQWCSPDALPVDLAPIARLGIAVHGPRTTPAGAAVELAIAC